MLRCVGCEGDGPSLVIVCALWVAVSDLADVSCTEIMKELRVENEEPYWLEELLENGGDMPAEAVEG